MCAMWNRFFVRVIAQRKVRYERCWPVIVGIVKTRNMCRTLFVIVSFRNIVLEIVAPQSCCLFVLPRICICYAGQRRRKSSHGSIESCLEAPIESEHCMVNFTHDRDSMELAHKAFSFANTEQSHPHFRTNNKTHPSTIISTATALVFPYVPYVCHRERIYSTCL